MLVWFAQMSKIELWMTGALPMAAGVCYGKGLVLAAAIIAGVVALYILAACLQPSAEWLLSHVTSALAFGAVKAKSSVYLCIKTLQVRLFKQACCTRVVKCVWSCSAKWVCSFVNLAGSMPKLQYHNLSLVCTVCMCRPWSPRHQLFAPCVCVYSSRI